MRHGYNDGKTEFHLTGVTSMTDAEAGPRRLTVNAAFLKDIKDDNRHLKSLLEEIATVSGHPEVATNHWPEITRLYGELRDQLAFHFSLEEAYGYFDSAIDAEPHLSAQSESLRGDHPKLFAMIRDLADRASEISPERKEKIVSVLKDYETFFVRFRKHEEAETLLILHALEDDIGDGD